MTGTDTKPSLVGIGTVLTDDPLLNCRIEGGKDPLRVICDTNLRTPLDSQIVRTAKEIPTIIASEQTFYRLPIQALRCCAHRSESPAKQKHIRLPAARSSPFLRKDRHPDLDALMEVLGKEKIDSILLEGGSQLAWSALPAGSSTKYRPTSPRRSLAASRHPVLSEVQAWNFPAECLALGTPDIRMLGDDILIESEVISCSQA